MNIIYRNRIWRLSSYLNIGWGVTFLGLFIVHFQMNFFIIPRWMIVMMGLFHLNTMIFWFRNLQIWYKRDKSFIQLLCLLYLSPFYSSFYYWKALRKDWLKESSPEGENEEFFETAPITPIPIIKQGKIIRTLKLCFLGFGCVGGNYFLMFYPIACLERMNLFEGSMLGYYIGFSLPFVIVAWVYNIVIWARKDRVVGSFFLIFPFYNLLGIFYFIRILKNKWV